MNNIMKDIYEASMKEKKTVEQLGLKLAEETGECTQAILSTIGACGCGYKGLKDSDIKEECVDVVLVALSLAYKLGCTEEELEEIFAKKINKWMKKVSEDKSKEPKIIKKIKQKVDGLPIAFFCLIGFTAILIILNAIFEII